MWKLTSFFIFCKIGKPSQVHQYIFFTRPTENLQLNLSHQTWLIRSHDEYVLAEKCPFYVQKYNNNKENDHNKIRARPNFLYIYIYRWEEPNNTTYTTEKNCKMKDLSPTLFSAHEVSITEL